MVMSHKVSPTDHNITENKLMHIDNPTNKFITNERDQNLHCWYWNPAEDQPIRAVVFISHGYSEHLQWYDDLANKLAAGGILAFGHDHVGHGRSDGVKGHITSFSHYVNDVLLHCEQIMKKHKGIPCFLVGHSMGGMISIMTAMKKPDMFKGTILMGPLIRPNPSEATPFKICMVKIIAWLFPYCPVAVLSTKNVTRDTEMRQKLHEDKFRYHGGIRAQWGMACFDEFMNLNDKYETVEWPFLILHGEKDLLCDPDAAVDFYARAKSKDKEIKIIPGACHHLYIEIPEVRKQALQDTVEWIKARL